MKAWHVSVIRYCGIMKAMAGLHGGELVGGGVGLWQFGWYPVEGWQSVSGGAYDMTRRRAAESSPENGQILAILYHTHIRLLSPRARVVTATQKTCFLALICKPAVKRIGWNRQKSNAPFVQTGLSRRPRGKNTAQRNVTTKKNISEKITGITRMTHTTGHASTVSNR